MDSDWVCDQTRIYLIDPLRHHFEQSGRDGFVSGDTFIYFVPPGSRKIRRLGPDFYVVAGGKSAGQTKWVSWEEGGLLPTTIFEFVSPTTESRDRGHKFCVYRDVFKTEDYFLIHPETLAIEGFHLSHGHYVALSPAADGWYWVNSLGLWLGVLDGWIRLRTPASELLTTGREVGQEQREQARQERERAERERERAERERERAEKAEAQLNELQAELRRLRGD